MATTPLIDAPTRTTYARGRARPSARDELDAHLRLQHRVDLLPSLVDGCHHASVTTVTGGRLVVRVSTDRAARRADELQDALGEGPCLQSVRTGHSVVAADLRPRRGGPAGAPRPSPQLGLTGALSVLLVANLRPFATLNLYSDTVGGLAELDLAHLHTLTAPLSGVLLHRLAR